MKLNLFTLHVRNFEESLHFYHDLMGLPIAVQFVSGDTQIAMLGEQNQPQLELVGAGADAKASIGLSIGLLTEDLDRAMADLKGKVPEFEGPISPNPHIRFAFTKDPDGYIVQLLERL